MSVTVAAISAAGAARQGDIDQAPDGSDRRQPAGCGQGVDAIRSQLAHRNVVPHEACTGRVSQQVGDHRLNAALGVGDALVAMQQRGKLGVMVSMRLVRDARIRGEHGPQSLIGASDGVSGFGQLFVFMSLRGRSGSGRQNTAMIRTGSCTARMDGPRTSPLTSGT
jgi:hypothetical protein